MFFVLNCRSRKNSLNFVSTLDPRNTIYSHLQPEHLRGTGNTIKVSMN